MICSQCNKEFIRSYNAQKYCSKICSEIRRTNQVKASQKKYDNSKKGKKTRQEWYDKIYRGSEKDVARKRRYTTSDKGRKNLKKYKQSDKGKIVKKRYNNSDSSRNASRILMKKKRKDPLFKLISLTRNRVWNFLKDKKFRKTNKTFELVGCSPAFLKKHLEKQFHHHPDTYQPMNWLNHTVHGWHIDHRIPLDSAKSQEDVIKLCHYTNLQPMWAKYNLKKSNKII